MKREDERSCGGIAEGDGKVGGAACAVARVERTVVFSVRSGIAVMAMAGAFGTTVVAAVVVMVRGVVLFEAGGMFVRVVVAGRREVVVRLGSGVFVGKIVKREMQRRNRNRREDERDCREAGGATLGEEIQSGSLRLPQCTRAADEGVPV